MTRIYQYNPEGWLINTLNNKKWLSSPATLSDAKKCEEILEGNVIMCDAEHNLIVDLGCMRGVIPRCEGAIGIDRGDVRDIALISRVGKPVCFTVTDIKTDNFGKPYALLSRKEAQKKCVEDSIKSKQSGMIINARVTHLESFGAFCDIGCGIVALLPIDAISVSRISHPGDRFSVGEDLKVIIKSIDTQNRITLTHKELLGSWEENIANFSEGQTVSGIIRSVESYGVFVELAPNLAGLAEPKIGAATGMTASVYIKSIIPEKMKVKLIIIDCFESDYSLPIKYFYAGEKIDFWRYSPENCIKNIYTDFLTY